MPIAKKVEPEESAADAIRNEEKTAVYMETGWGWATASGSTFTRDNPYQMVPWSEANELFKTGRFRQASPDEVKSYYKI